ncbi:MAG: DoxX family protein [Niabella sp.]|nr:MAG: DoxX family protein [Niabella sp.]
MKVLINFIRVFVGVLFIFSGLVKANDPMGLSYKMQEFFFAWGMSSLDGISLSLSVLMIAFEIFAGAALILGWRAKTISWLLLLLIVFFTFLTGYAFLSGKFKNCGCFGDCIPITSKQSFIKDIILLILIIILFFSQNYIKPILSKGGLLLSMLLVFIFSFASQWFTLKNLPLADCLPFKKGNNISEQMKMPANAVPDSTVITFEYEKEGKKISFTGENFPDDFNDSTYKFINRYDKVIRPGKNNEPPIKTFILNAQNGEDITQKILNDEKVVLIFMEDASTPIKKWQTQLESLYNASIGKNIPIYIITSAAPKLSKIIANTAFKNIELLNGDNTMIRMAARTNPTCLVLNKGTIVAKESYSNFNKIQL